MRNERELVIGLRQRDPGLFEEFVRRFEHRVFFTSLRMVGERDDALDVAQEVFLKIWCHAPKLKKEIILTQWVYRVTINTCIDCLRQRHRQNSKVMRDELILLKLPSPGISPREHARLQEEFREIKNAINQLTEHQRSIFVLRHFQNLKMQEIANVMELPLGTVKSTLHQSLIKVRGILKEANSFFPGKCNKSQANAEGE